MHTEEDVAPSAVLKVDMGHGVHPLEPSDTPYLPASHSWQEDSFNAPADIEYFPMGQKPSQKPCPERG